MPITSGTVTYEEKRKIAEFENKTAKVELSFTLEDGEDFDTVISQVTELAVTRVASMLTGKPIPVVANHISANVAPKTEAPILTRSGTMIATAEAPKAPKAPKAKKEAAAPPPPLVEPAPVVEAEDEFGFDEPTPEPPKEITDTDLLAFCRDQSSRLNGKAQRVKATVGRFVQPGQTAINIPQAKRAEFMAAVRELQPLADVAA